VSKRTAFVWMFVLAVSAALPLAAATFVVPSDRALVQKSDAIITGQVLLSYGQMTPGGSVMTVTEVSVTEVLKGAIAQRSVIHITSPGGEAGDRITYVPGAPQYTQGESVLLFLNGSPERGWGATDLAVGKFAFRTDSASRKIATRDEGEIIGWDLNGQAYHPTNRAAQPFLDFVRATAAGLPAAEKYVISAAVSPFRTDSIKTGADTVGTPLTYSMSNSTNSSPGFRWQSFGAGKTWVNQNTLAGAAGSGVTSITTGLGAWTNDCGSNVNYLYGGADATATGKLDAADGKNAIHFEVNLNTAYYGNVTPFNCGGGGVIAIGGITSASAPHAHPVSGESFYTILEGDVDVNVGLANCAFSASEGFLTAMTHELGHTLGFRHSNQDRVGGACPGTSDCSGAAIMNSFVVGGYSGALQTWDQNCVRAVYPSPCGTAPVRFDVNGDGKADILWRNTSTGQNYFFLMNGLNRAGEGTLNTIPDQNWVVAGVADFNGDGRADVLFHHNVSGQNYIFLIAADGISKIGEGTLNTTPDANWKVAGTGDFDGDGRADILYRNFVTGQNYIFLINVGGLTVKAEGLFKSVPDLNWVVAGVADFNHDGRADMLYHNNSTGMNYIFFPGPTGLTVGAEGILNSTPDLNWKIQGVGDLDADGDADIVYRNTSTGQNYIFLVNTLTIKNSAPFKSITDQNWQYAQVADFNGDGKVDILARNSVTGQNYIYFMNGLVVDAAGEGFTATTAAPWKVTSNK
jgi:hypothetical protein